MQGSCRDFHPLGGKRHARCRLRRGRSRAGRPGAADHPAYRFGTSRDVPVPRTGGRWRIPSRKFAPRSTRTGIGVCRGGTCWRVRGANHPVEERRAPHRQSLPGSTGPGQRTRRAWPAAGQNFGSPGPEHSGKGPGAPHHAARLRLTPPLKRRTSTPRAPSARSRRYPVLGQGYCRETPQRRQQGLRNAVRHRTPRGVADRLPYVACAMLRA